MRMMQSAPIMCDEAIYFVWEGPAYMSMEVGTSGLRVASGYTYPGALVETDWVEEHLTDPALRLIEVDEDVSLYETGHLPGAVKLDWHADVQHKILRDFLDQQAFEQLLSGWGIRDDHTIVFYGDGSNRYTCYAFWLFRMYGHQQLKVMNGGRSKWEMEGRPLTREAPQGCPSVYHAQVANGTMRIFREDVLSGLRNPARRLIDVRLPEEYRGEHMPMPSSPQESVQRGGHMPGAKNIPWSLTVNADGTFKSAEELRQLYGSKDVTPDKEVIVYCNSGERSAHTWFVLTQLLGFPRVRNYDGSWTEWGNMVRVPVER
jgi:thiosulfate/3-mercaptopyruvate sulfurtransferase